MVSAQAAAVEVVQVQEEVVGELNLLLWRVEESVAAVIFLSSSANWRSGPMQVQRLL